MSWLRCIGIFHWMLGVYRSFKMRDWDYDVVISNGYDGIVPYFKNQKTKYIKVAHGNFNSYLDCKGIAYFDYLVFLCNAELSLWRAKYPNVAMGVIPNFLNQIPDQESDLSQKVAICVGRLSYEKGFFRLLEIWTKIKNDQALKEWKLHIVGDGSLKEDLQAQIKANNIADSVLIKPFTSEIDKEYIQSSIYLMTSFYEGLPLVLLEASSYALPIVAFDVPTGPKEVIEHGRNGFLIKDHYLEEFCEVLKELMLDQNLRESLGKASKMRVKEKFYKEAIYKRWQKLIEDESSAPPP